MSLQQKTIICRGSLESISLRCVYGASAHLPARLEEMHTSLQYWKSYCSICRPYHPSIWGLKV